MALNQGARAVRPRRWWPAGLAWVLWTLAMLGIAASLWWDHLLRQAGRADLVQSNASGLAFLLALVSAPTVGAVLAARRPRHPVGWLLLGLGASIGLTGFTDGYALYGLLARPGSLPAARWLAIYGPSVAVAVTVVALVVGALSLVVRFRRARGTERQQLRWVALAAVLASLAILMALAGMVTRNAALRNWGIGVSFAVLPPAIGAAVLRYRLYDLDRILSRTLAYGLLTVVLAGGYAAVVLGLGQLLGRDSSLAVASATRSTSTP
jgi:hypothetical protein